MGTFNLLLPHLTGYSRPKLIRDHLWEHRYSNARYVLYNQISEQKSPLSGTSISLGCHSKAMMGRMTAMREMSFNNYTGGMLRTKFNAR